MEKDNDESDEFEVEGGDDFTDTDLFDPETIAAELESVQEESPKRTASSARAAIEEMIERKRLRSAIKEFDDDDFDMSAL